MPFLWSIWAVRIVPSSFIVNDTAKYAFLDEFCAQNDRKGCDKLDIWDNNEKIWNASRICVSSLRRGHANLLCIVPILVYVPPKRYSDLYTRTTILKVFS